ncbi:MAG: PH domain-containing protein [Nitriliruptoraceae bacterium]
MRVPRRWLQPDERVLATFRPHWRRLVPIVALAMLCGAGAGVALAALDPPERTYVIAGLVAGWLLVAVRPITRRWFSRYVLTDRRLVARFGMIARSGTELPLTHIANIGFRQSIVQRLLGYGTVTIELLGDRDDVELIDVPDPSSVESAIWAARGMDIPSGEEPFDEA